MVEKYILIEQLNRINCKGMSKNKDVSVFFILINIYISRKATHSGFCLFVCVCSLWWIYQTKFYSGHKKSPKFWEGLKNNTNQT